MNREVFIVAASILVMLCLYFYMQGQGPHETTMRAVKAAIVASHRPRVLFFRANWCGASQSFGFKLKRAIDVYGKSIDWQEVNVDDPTYSALWGKLNKANIHTVPCTFIFNDKAELVSAFTGCMEEKDVNEILRKIYLESIGQSTKVAANQSNTGKSTLAAKH